MRQYNTVVVIVAVGLTVTVIQQNVPIIQNKRWIFIAKIYIACSTCFGHYYAHHQELKSIVQMEEYVYLFTPIHKIFNNSG